ncbi:MAG: biosynthetic-type acetolactate synthase large subunit [Christensenellaceae bacterium]|nr:biosynthetic-type acetolactate synthase large subunit [Christensenellaceae bacterium]
MIKTGSQIVMECLLEQGVDVVFGYPGGAALAIYDALFEYSSSIRHILTTHEQHAAHAADGYARATGKVGVALSTSGPGATNLLTGIAAAYMDSVPVVAITCNVGKNDIGKDSFQEVDIFSISMPVTKHNFLVRDIRDLAPTLRKAFAIAASGRPGPVLVDILCDVTTDSCHFQPQTVKKTAPSIASDDLDFSGALALINESTCPMIYAGGGIVASGAEQALLAFSEKIKAPVALTLMGIGCFPPTHPHYAGMLGLFGSQQSAKSTDECDLLIAIGTRFSDRTVPCPETFAPGAKILHIDVDPAEINKNVRCHMSLLGDARLLLEQLTAHVSAKAENPLLANISPAKAIPAPAEGDTLRPDSLLALLGSLAGEDQLYTTEVGENQLWAARWLPVVGSRRFITSGGLGAMGFGLGAAIGAAVATGSRVINIAGDASFYMNMAELSTLAAYDLPIIQVVLNNRSLGLVRQMQTDRYDGRLSAVDFDRPTDLTALAAAFGIGCDRIQTVGQAEAAIQKALAAKGPFLLECMIDPAEPVPGWN